MDTLMNYVESAWALPWVRTLVGIVIAVTVARLVEFLIRRFLLTWARKTPNHYDDIVVLHLKRPIYFTVMLTGIAWSTRPLALGPGAQHVCDALFETLAIILWSVAANRIGSTILVKVSNEKRDGSLVQPRTLAIFELALKSCIVAISIYVVFLAWRIDLTAWLASAGILGVALGFAAKDSLANLFSGVFILVDGPYTIGDHIILEDGMRGRVTGIGMRSTRILTIDQTEISIPNAVIGNTRVINESGGPGLEYRLRIKISVAYGSDIPSVRQALSQSCINIPGTLTEPPPKASFMGFGASGLDFQVLVWLLNSTQREEALDKINENIYNALRDAQIEIPYEKLDLYLKEAPGLGQLAHHGPRSTDALSAQEKSPGNAFQDDRGAGR